MGWEWLVLFVVGGAVTLYVIVCAGLSIVAAVTDKREVGSMRYVSGETIIVPPEPERPRKRWRITIERS